MKKCKYKGKQKSNVKCRHISTAEKDNTYAEFDSTKFYLIRATGATPIER